MTITPIDKNKSKFNDFLELYADTGSLVNSLEVCNLNIHQLRKKQLEDKEFDNNYRRLSAVINTNKAIIAREKLQDIMLQNINQGYIAEENLSRKVIKDPLSGEVLKIEDTSTRKKKPLPDSYYQRYLGDSDIMKAVATLCENGLIPESYAQKVLAMQSKIVENIKSQFNPDSNADELTQKSELVNLIKQALVEI